MYIVQREVAFCKNKTFDFLNSKLIIKDKIKSFISGEEHV